MSYQFRHEAPELAPTDYVPKEEVSADDALLEQEKVDSIFDKDEFPFLVLVPPEVH